MMMIFAFFIHNNVFVLVFFVSLHRLFETEKRSRRSSIVEKVIQLRKDDLFFYYCAVMQY
jgi:hypothetical protein